MQTTQSLTIRPFIVADKYSVVKRERRGREKRRRARWWWTEGRRKEGRKEGGKVGGARWLTRSLPRIGSGLKNEFILDRGGRSGGALGQFRGRTVVDTCWLLAFDVGLSSRAWCIGAGFKGWWPKGETHRSP